MDTDQLFFATEYSLHSTEVHDLPSGYQAEFWTPRGLRLRPDGVRMIPFIIWSVVFHHGRLFRNRGYQLLLIRKNEELVHRSCVFPGYFRFPFMATEDLQVGDTWTAPTERGKGLAAWALSTILKQRATRANTVWYICDKNNAASIAVARKAGMKFVGQGVRTRRFGLNLLGKFQIIGSSSVRDL